MDFTHFVEREIQRSLPQECIHAASNQLLGEAPVFIQHAFYCRPTQGRSRLVHVMVIPPSLQLDTAIEKKVIALQDYILSEDWLLVVVSQEEDSGHLGDTGIFIEEQLDIHHPNVLWIKCVRQQHDMASVIFEQVESVGEIIHDLWNGSLYYHGPRTGLQQLNLELMKDKCPRCGHDIRTVTGIVYPDRQLQRWNNNSWAYYNQLVALTRWNGANADKIAHLVTMLRQADESIVLVSRKIGRHAQDNALAARCPRCRSLRGEFDVEDFRARYLFSLESRLNGSLQYHSITLEIDRAALRVLHEGYEANDHACDSGWRR